MIRPATTLACVALAAVLLVACGDDVDTQGDEGSLGTGLDGPVARHREPRGTGGEDALMGGRLVLEGDCLYLGPMAGPGERFPVVWPAGTSWDVETGAVVLPSGDSVAIGEAVSGGGGAHGVSSVEATAGDEAAALVASCLDNTYGEVTIFNNFPDAVRRQ